MRPPQPKLVTGCPGSPIDLGGTLGLAYKRADPSWVTRLGFAYASNSGLDVLLSKMVAVPGWRSTRKQWIVGLHHGITEPTALERIRAIANCRLRVFVGAERLSAASLLHGPLFHAKVVCIVSGVESSAAPVCLLASSANLTGAALASGARNYEAGIALFESGIPTEEYARFREWWARAWTASVSVTGVLLDQYTRLRDRFLTRNPDALADLDLPSGPQLDAAGTLWIEAGAMSGGSRNQVEFNRELAAFFGPVERGTRPLRIRANDKEWDDRALSHKTTTFGVDIWRLSLPTETTGGFVYQGKLIRFRKARDPEARYFEVDVVELESPRHTRWRSAAHRRGYVGVTSGQRAYGFF